MNTLRILIVDDEQDICQGISEFLKKRGYQTQAVWDIPKAFRMVATEDVDIAVFDINLGSRSGIDLLKEFKKHQPDGEAIMITGRGDQDAILHSMREGAFDFFTKPISLSELQSAIERTSRYALLHQQIHHYSHLNQLMNQDLSRDVGDIIGRSDAMRSVISQGLKAAEFPDTNVLITGPNGSGKDLLARVIHFASSRREHIFLPVNSAAIPENLMESEFFGYKKGAFTDARENREGFFEAAHNGTLFLDEIGDMNLSVQAKILRVIQDGRVKRLGDHLERSVDVRVVCATNQDIHRLIDEKRFRQDLYYRLNTVEIRIPPLVERLEDLPDLLSFFIDRIGKKLGKSVQSYSDEVLDALSAYSFPGNVRELRNLIERAIIVSDSPVLKASDFQLSFFPEKEKPSTEKMAAPQAGKESAVQIRPAENTDFEDLNLERIIKLTLQKGMKQAEGNKSRAAGLLGISRFALDRKLKKYFPDHDEDTDGEQK